MTTPATKINSTNPRPLEGITVVSLEQAVAAPFCTRQLADQGARIIKVERPGAGDFARGYDSRVNGLSSHFVWLNRSKESLALDLKNPKHHEVLMRLLGRADVLVQNLAPGASARLGLSHKTLKEKHPSLIVCNISGYGEDGPYRDKKAYDLLIQSEAGLLSVTGSKEDPAKVGISVADIAAGMYAYTNILTALMQRAKDGVGRKIDISMLESMVEWMGFPLYYTYDKAPPPARAGASHAAIYPYGLFETGDGRQVMLGIQNEREWRKFCEVVLRQPKIATNPKFVNNSLRSQHRDDLKDIICKSFSTLTADEVITLLEEAQIANASVNNMHDVWDHPQLKARRRWAEVQTPGGIVPALLPPGFTNDDQNASWMRPVPGVGEHNDVILEELGITDINKNK